MKKIIEEYAILTLIASFIIIVDQITKEIVRMNIPFGSAWMPLEWLAPFIRIVHWENTGAAFGLFQGGGAVFAVMAVVVSIFIVIYYPKIPRDEKLMRIALAMQMGGALGNLVDRLRFGPVTDFIAVSVFPVFNIADASITIGVGLLLFGLWLSERREREQTSIDTGGSKTDIFDSET